MKVRVNGLAWLPKRDLTIEQLRGLRAALTIVPSKAKGFNDDEEPKPIYLFDEDNEHIGIARGYFQLNQKPRHEIEWDLTEGRKDLWAGPIDFAGNLRSEQEQALQTVIPRLRAGQLGGIVRAVPGWGKTVVGLALAARMQVPTLIVVHKEFLMAQWEERIATHLPGARVGHVQQDVCDYRDKHIVLAMVHSLAGKEYPLELYEWPGLIMVDEVHRIGAYTWAPVPQKFKARWRIGWSATPRRKDGADDVLHYHIGPLLFAAKEQRMKPTVKRVWTEFKLIRTENFNPNLAKRGLVLKFLCASTARNRLIVEQIIRAVQSGRKLIVLSERIKHLESLEALFKEMWPTPGIPAVDYYIGGRSQQELDIAREARVILATTQYAAEGLDIPELDTLFLTTPMSDVEQAVGRILRPHPAKKEPIVVDFRDDAVVVCKQCAGGRDRYYDSVA